MQTANYVVNLILSVVLIVGGYQFYFWCQRNTVLEPRELRLPIDERIPFRPTWVWIYSFLYYPAILYVNLVLDSPAQFTLVATSYLMLLAFQMAFFLAFPVRTPPHWRQANGRQTLSERFLAFVQRFDAETNSFPSMHVSVAMLTSLHLYPHIGHAVWLFPVLIGVSCLFTKQHYFIDLPAGALLGWVDYQLFTALLLN